MIVFWCDTRSTIGLGHIVRCLAIAEAASRRGEQCEFVVSELWPGLERFLAHYDFGVVAGDLDTIPHSVEFIVVDGYEFDTAPLEFRESHTMLLDDLGQRNPPVDIVLNPNIYAPTLSYPAASRWLLGADYALLRPEFVEARARREAPRATVGRVFVMLGGVDPTNETSRVLDALDATGFAGTVDLVTAREDLGGTDYRFELAVHRSIASPAELMCQADLAICAAGGSTWELACIGVPAIQVVVADNQAGIGAWLAAHDSAIVLEAPVDNSELSAAIQRMAKVDVRAQYAERARAMVDGRGAERVVDALLDLER